MSRASGCLFLLVGVFASSSSGNASTIMSFAGNFIFDDDVQFFTYLSPLTAGPVTVNTTSFSVGGFAPILAVYNAMGDFLFRNDGTAFNYCSIPGAGPDVGAVGIPATGFCYDSSLT